MKETFRAAWKEFWFRPEGPVNLIAARAIVSANALWILLSRPDLPDILAWPRAFWISVDRGLALRFLIFGLPAFVEEGLYVLLGLSLAAALFGVLPRLACFTAAVLLYHFAPLEDIFASRGGPFFRGLTVPVLALFLLAFADAPRRNASSSPEWRWPLAAIQVCFAFTYLLSGISKLITVGPAWATARNFEGLVLGLMLPEVTPPWAHVFVGNTLLCWLGAVFGILIDFAPPLALFSRKAARWIVPAVFLGHLAIIPIFGVVFLALPQLLLFVDWEGGLSALRRLRARQ